MSEITIRSSRPADALVIDRLATLDSAEPLAGAALLAEVCGKPVAAMELASGRAVADPFRRTADVLELMRMHRATVTPRSRRGRFVRPRLA